MNKSVIFCNIFPQNTNYLYFIHTISRIFVEHQGGSLVSFYLRLGEFAAAVDLAVEIQFLG